MENIKGNKIDEEIIAVISAAVAAMEIKQGYRLVVRNITRVPTVAPVWNTAGRIDRLSRKLNT
ncbi:MAG: sodium pump decarboxylase subunit gamma [Bacillota bacterium]|nr:sodium pump decarboxylase subunit gamma [Bacillota bacterium]